MDPPPFNFNAAANSASTSQPAPSAFGSTLQPKATFGSSLFGKPSLLAGIAKREADKPAEKNDPGPSNSLAGRLTRPSKGKETAFKGKGDLEDSQVPNLKEGAFTIRPRGDKVPFGLLGMRRKAREGTPEGMGNESGFSNKPKHTFEPKPTRPALQAPLFSAIGKKDNDPPRSLFGKPTIMNEGVDEVDHAAKKELPPVMFGIPLATSSSSLKGFGSMPSFQEKPFAAAVKPMDKTWKPARIRNRESPAPESRLPMGTSNSEEGKLVQKLASLRQQVCPDDFEKYKILDERDKILCQLREINSNLVLRLVRCEEMCTEKERYQRIVQKGVSPFECDESTGEVSHEMMVKQYARSAADQERPLPHDLRSEKIMNHTMCYLLHNILDEFPDGADQRAAWYNFLWSRTRALRKEVTQLSMSDTMALNLVERCTRLHILFGYVLCDLETEHFDAAMNNETLGKCIQTLRHLYEDFAKRGIPCENEPEFRSYDVMLYMTDTNVLSQVLSYRSEVRQSEPVRLALQLATAFRDKNYCRFFRLLKTQASFLQCCVAHKLFAATRSSAIAIMIQSYGRTNYPLEKLQRVLAFDSTDDLVFMLNLYGLQTEKGSDHVMLSKDDLTLNEVVPLQPYDWIDAKNSGKMSQVVYGPGLFQFIASRCDVSNSFNHRNEYAHDKVLDAVLDGSNIPINNESSALSFAQSAGSFSAQAAAEQRRKADMERFKKQEESKRDQLVERMMNRVIDQVVHGIAVDETRKAEMVREQMRALEDAKRMKEEEDRRREDMERRRREKEQETARKIAERIEKEVAEKEAKKIAREQMEKERKERETQLAQIIMEKFWERSVVEAVDQQIMNICEEMVNEKEVIMEGLEVFRDRITKQWLLQFWDRWREFVRWKKEKRARKMQIIVKSVPKWESEEVANDLLRKYAAPSDKQTNKIHSILDRPTHSVRLAAFKKNRRNRIGQRVIDKWRSYAKNKVLLKKMAEDQQKRENKFFRRFEKAAVLETRYKFSPPEDATKKNRRKSDKVERSPLRDTRNVVLFAPSTSLFVARRQLEDWQPNSEIPTDLKEKMKRKRESFEKAREEHLLKKKKDEELISLEANVSIQKISIVAGEADHLLDETLQYTADLDKMMAELRARRVDDL